MYKVTAFIKSQQSDKEFDIAEFWLAYPPRIGECLWFLPCRDGEEYCFKVTKVRHTVFYKREKLSSDGSILFEFEKPPLPENSIDIEAVHIREWA